MAIYLNIDGLKGDVTAAGHEEWIECMSLQWGVGRGIHTPTGSSQERESSAPFCSAARGSAPAEKPLPAPVITRQRRP